jgi:hypothetical protein
MKALGIDFGWSKRPTGRILGMLMLGAAVAGATGQGWHYLQLRTEAEAWQADLGRIDRSANAPRVKDSPEERERLLAELRYANRIIDKLDTPWDALFGAVETTEGEQAVLLGVEPDAERREVRLTGEAKDSAAMLDYLRELRGMPAIRDAHLTGHQINVEDPQRPVRFIVQANWTEPPAPKAAAEAVADGAQR